MKYCRSYFSFRLVKLKFRQVKSFVAVVNGCSCDQKLGRKERRVRKEECVVRGKLRLNEEENSESNLKE